MLKSLELIGFKSFAEKTRFDFGPGITAIVGPNGSGKSNIVDAVRWILGEQSAKSLRGGEMADVIFNGSSTRRSLGMAEVTLTIDNRRKHLPIDCDEVQITRRVYRSGEGEYLINKQPARLRDIKELFLGSGAGSAAYCVIEQGRVDVLLESSTRERRVIFEEAAGISRFKAKKTETLRKLEHVEQNLLRVRDIIEEVDRRLRSVKLQASKAQRYRDYADRLRQLRVDLSLAEYHQGSADLTRLTDELEKLRQSLAEQSQRSEIEERELQRLERQIEELDQQDRRADADRQAAVQTIVTEQRSLEHGQRQQSEIREELHRAVDQLQRGVRELANAEAERRRTEDQLRQVDEAVNQQQDTVDRHETLLRDLYAQLASLREQIKTDKSRLLEQMRAVARLHNEKVGLDAQIDGLEQHRRRLEQKLRTVRQQLLQIERTVAELSQSQTSLTERLDNAKGELESLRQERDDARRSVESATTELGELRSQYSAQSSRIQVLEQLERQGEGLSPGVREVQELVSRTHEGPWQTVIGVVADLIEAPREYASLIDLILGERSQHVVVRDWSQLHQALAELPHPLTGRVTFFALPSVLADGAEIPDAEATSLPGVVASAANVIRATSPEAERLAEALLGDTLIVRDLAAARAIAERTSKYRLVTLSGELLEPGATLTVGQHGGDTGLLSRRSELRDLKELASRTGAEIQATEQRLAEHKARLADLETAETEVQRRLDLLGQEAADLRSSLNQTRLQQEDLNQEESLTSVELQQTEEDLASVVRSREETEQKAETARQIEQEIQRRLETAETDCGNVEQRQQEVQKAWTSAKVALAQAREKRDALASQFQNAERSWEQLSQRQEQTRQQVDSLQARLHENELHMLHSLSRLASAYADKERAEARSRDLRNELDRLRKERQRRADALSGSRKETQEQQDQLHQLELQANDVQHRLNVLTERLRDEHDLDLVELYHGYRPPESPIDHAAADEEIAELRRKMNRLGNVNLEALQELEELESRSANLRSQCDDLNNAKRALDDIIQRINQDSRRLFAETFESIRGHFQDLFRKLFGGGMADIVLEDENDILESGIEIVARPPGKELRSISLLSGGEKTLTAVALVLAIFRSKPSPFCVLDEVDAALDEANTDRFSAVLRSLVEQSQFIMITHSKKTMVAADVLYGVTMQEAGVSKRVAVRLEDWPEEGRQGESSDTPTETASEQAEHAA